MDIYKLLRLNQKIKSHRIKFVGLWLLSVLNKRYLSIQLDPVLACNLRCKMCYFTDADFVKKNMKGILKAEQLDPIAKAVFRNALKLQIGCGAEPTLFKHNTRLIELANSHGVPYVSMVTNGNLLTRDDISAFAGAGLNEFIMSMHGVLKDSYENFMDKGDYDKFRDVLGWISEQKTKSPNLRLRINYTFNRDNFNELSRFFELFGQFDIDIIQLRPIDKIGETTYNDFSLKSIESDYLSISHQLKEQAQQRKITLLYPQSVVREEAQSLKVRSSNDSSYLIPYTYCYVSPDFFWKEDFNPESESFSQWKSRTGWNRQLLKNAFLSLDTLMQTNRNMLNYAVDIN